DVSVVRVRPSPVDSERGLVRGRADPDRGDPAGVVAAGRGDHLGVRGRFGPRADRRLRGSAPPTGRGNGPRTRPGNIRTVPEADVPLRRDARREEGLEHAAKLVAEAWQSFDRYRPEEPPLDERVRRLLQSELPTKPGAAHEAGEHAARILDESIAQPCPRYFVGVGSSGLEIGTIGDLLAHTYDINLAVDARAATLIAKQPVRWAAAC